RSDGDNNGTTLPDLGAFEVQGFVVTTGADGGGGSLRAAVDANNQFGGGGIFFRTTAMGGNAVTGETAGGPGFGPSAFLISHSVTIQGDAVHGITITRDASAPAFRIFNVDPNVSLTLQNLTVSSGVAQGGSSDSGGGAAGLGGAIFNQGSLTLT